MQGYERCMEEDPEQTRSESLLHCKSSFVLNLNERTQNLHKFQNEKEELAAATKSLKLPAELTIFPGAHLWPRAVKRCDFTWKISGIRLDQCETQGAAALRRSNPDKC